MEHTTEPTIEKFFEAYERSSAARDAGLYSASFLAAGPNDVQIVKSSDLLHAIPERKQLLEAIGCQSTTLVSVHETKPVQRSSMVRTEWRWRLNRGDNAPVEITLPSTFIVQRSGERVQIALYLTHEDIMTVLRDRGPNRGRTFGRASLNRNRTGRRARANRLA